MTEPEFTEKQVFVEEVNEPRFVGRCRYCSFRTDELASSEDAGWKLADHTNTQDHRDAVMCFVVKKRAQFDGTRDFLFPSSVTAVGP